MKAFLPSTRKQKAAEKDTANLRRNVRFGRHGYHAYLRYSMESETDFMFDLIPELNNSNMNEFRSMINFYSAVESESLQKTIRKKNSITKCL